MRHVAIRKIGVLTSGGDAPGMNACIRAVTRAGIYHGLEVAGIKRGFQGMIDNDIEALVSGSVSNIVQRGGTILKSARCLEFHDPEKRKLAYHNLKSHKIDGLVLIGGDGTFKGGDLFSREFDIPVVGIPGTIDNDLVGTDFTIGYDTAINTVVENVDRIRDTANSHDRLFFIEVMGKDAGFIALRSGIGVGAEAILVPETTTFIDELIEMLEKQWSRKKSSIIIMIAEGDDAGGAFEVAKKVKERFNNYETRVSILGHLQRGGSPSAMDRVLATRLGSGAVEALLDGVSGQMVGIVNKEIQYTSLEKAIKHHTKLNKELLELARIMSS